MSDGRWFARSRQHLLDLGLGLAHQGMDKVPSLVDPKAPGLDAAETVLAGQATPALNTDVIPSTSWIPSAATRERFAEGYPASLPGAHSTHLIPKGRFEPSPGELRSQPEPGGGDLDAPHPKAVGPAEDWPLLEGLLVAAGRKESSPGLSPDGDQDHGLDADHGLVVGLVLDHQHDHAEGVCAELPLEANLLKGEGAIAGAVGVSAGVPLVAYANTFRLSSNPTARTTIYLDFDGHTTQGTLWNDSTMGASFYSPAYNTDGNASSFSTAELTLIQQAWQRVASDFAPFDVNVTTLAPPDDWLIKTIGANDPNYGIRVVMSSYGPSSTTAGGIAYINSFNWDSDTPCFVYNTSLVGVSEAVSHEVGHTLGLSHDGILSGASYYSGHGSGENGWASIMGVGYYQNVTTWDNGTFYNSNNGGSNANYNRGPDDLSIITGINGFGYVSDQEGNNQATANALSIQAGSISQYGTIETASDLDWYSFTLANTGSINLTFDPYWYRAFLDTDGVWGGPVNPYYARISDANTGTAWADNGANLDLAVELYNSANVLIASANPSGLAANLNLSNLLADTYYLKLDGVGFGTPTVNPPTGYSDYGSIGSYLISGTITGAGVLPQISLALGPNFSVAEDGTANLLYTFSRTGDTSSALTVNVTLGGTATLGTDVAIVGWSAGTVSFAAGQATATVSVDPTADAIQESDETVALQITSGTGYAVATTTAVGGVISNDDVPVVNLTVAPAVVSEDEAPNLIFTFSRSYATANALVVSYTLGGTATNGVDYTGPSTSGVVKTITIAANATTATLTVNPTSDTVVEGDESVALTLFQGFGYSIGTSSAVIGTISNDDLPFITLGVSPATVAEAGSEVLVFTFTRTAPVTDALTVNILVSGTATNGVDYAALGSSVTFAAGSSIATLTIDPFADALVENTETVAITLQNGNGYLVGTSSAVVGTILNSDPPVISLSVSPATVRETGADGGLLYTFLRSGALADALTVSYTLGGTATNGSDYASIGSSISFAAGAASATLLVTPLADAVSEADETVTLSLTAGNGYTIGTSGAVVGTLTNVDLPLISLRLEASSVVEDGGTPLRYIFQRNPLNGDPLSVAYTVAGSATAGSDYGALSGTITFASGAAEAVLEVLPTPDTTFETNETIDLSLVAGSSYTIVTPGVVSGTILNDDLPLVTLAVAPAAVNENSGSAMVYTFSRTGPTNAALTVTYGVGGTATLGSDYSGIASAGTTKSVSFAAGAATTSVSVTPIGDTTVEANETVALTLLSGSGYAVGTSTAVVGTISNDDLPNVSLAVSPSTVTEGGSTNLTFTFSRSVATADPLTVSYTVAGSATVGVDYTGISSGSGTQTVTIAGGASTAQVVVDPTDDTAVESNETVVLTLAAGSGYTVATSTAITGTISNDDSNPTQLFTASQDTLTGLSGPDRFQLTALKNALFVSSTPLDKVISLNTTEDRFDSPLRSTAITPTNAGSASSLSANAIGNRLNNTRFVANGAATFTVGSGSSLRTFLGINDGLAGYQAANDAIIEITGYTGALTNLQVV